MKQPKGTESGQHTNGANDGSATEVLHGDHLRVELGVPLQLHTVAEMVDGVAGGHFEGLYSESVEEEKKAR